MDSEEPTDLAALAKGLLIILVLISRISFAQRIDSLTNVKPTVDEVARERQNPVNGFRSVFLQDVILPVGEGNAHSFSIQPVWPFRLGKNWRLNTYTIIPIQSIPPLTADGSRASGLGNILFNAFIRPEKSKSKLVWGVGPALQIPTRTDPELGSNRFSAGPAACLARSSVGGLRYNFRKS
ncbi:hypothetical protein WBG78_30630 [Chryseolinea sp. T2]|uniref:hypothetical protein n=1 Tax=Chryseolinea sp. T2 TaxID=3129255 RepID=UPI0030780A94